jgi:hypothetical protein
LGEAGASRPKAQAVRSLGRRSDPAGGLDTELVQVSEHLLEALISALGGNVGGRAEPFRASRESGGDDDDLIGGVDQQANAEGQAVGFRRRFARRYQ